MATYTAASGVAGLAENELTNGQTVDFGEVIRVLVVSQDLVILLCLILLFVAGFYMALYIVNRGRDRG